MYAVTLARAPSSCGRQVFSVSQSLSMPVISSVAQRSARVLTPTVREEDFSLWGAADTPSAIYPQRSSRRREAARSCSWRRGSSHSGPYKNSYATCRRPATGNRPYRSATFGGEPVNMRRLQLAMAAAGQVNPAQLVANNKEGVFGVGYGWMSPVAGRSDLNG